MSELKKAVEKCKESQIADVVIVRDVTRSLIGRADHIGQRALGLVASDRDVVYRNRMRASVKKLNKGERPETELQLQCTYSDFTTGETYYCVNIHF